MESGTNAESGPVPPEINPGSPRKHSCADCHACLLCSDARCNSCLSTKHSGSCPKLSLAEQIRLYDEINVNDPILRKRRR